MSSHFEEWLNKCEEQASTSDNQIVVIGVTGKDSDDQANAERIDKFLRAYAFCGDWKDNLSPVRIDAYFSGDENVLFLLLHGPYESATRNNIFLSDTTGNKSFFEKLEYCELRYVHLLHILFILCHTILFFDESCNFDADWLRIFSSVNLLRQKSSFSIRKTLAVFEESEGPALPGSWLKTGRVSSKFPRNHIRQDLATDKKKEILENMEKALENQIYFLLKGTHVVGESTSGESSLGTVTINAGQPFVYIFAHKEQPVDVSQELIKVIYSADPSMKMGSDEISNWIQKRVEKEEQKRIGYNFDFFLKTAINNVRKSLAEKKDKEKLKLRDASTFPTLAEFVSGAKSILSWMIGDEDEPDELNEYAELNRKINSEFTRIKQIVESAFVQSLRFYNAKLEKQAMIGGEPVFSKSDHLMVLAEASAILRRCCSCVGNERISNSIEKLLEECEKIWRTGHERCETLSLTDRMCVHGQHSLPDVEKHEKGEPDSGVSSQRCILHDSGHNAYTFCNCGHSRLSRKDPFTLDDANFEFYQRAAEHFGCCAKLERFEFPVFKVPSSDLVANLAHLNRASSACSSSSSSDGDWRWCACSINNRSSSSTEAASACSDGSYVENHRRYGVAEPRRVQYSLF